MGNGVDYMMYSHAWHSKPNDATRNALGQNPETLRRLLKAISLQELVFSIMLKSKLENEKIQIQE
jgi:hypothetical protein